MIVFFSGVFLLLSFSAVVVAGVFGLLYSLYAFQEPLSTWDDTPAAGGSTWLYMPAGVN